LGYSFAECPALEEVVLPSFVTLLGPYAFENCGTIQKMTVPCSLITVSAHAFVGTTIEKVDYRGTEENFKNMSVNPLGNEGFTSAEFSFLPPCDMIIIRDLKQLKDVEYGSIVQVEGYISLHTTNNYLFLINEDNSFGVQIYTTYYCGEIPSRFSKVRITGTWTKYTGQDQIASIESIEILSSEAVHIEPIAVTIEDLEKNPELYYCRYLEFTGTIYEKASPPTVLLCRPDGSPSNIYIYRSALTQKEGPIRVFGTLAQYNNITELLMDSSR
jgi:hypothetical protein